MASGKVPLTLLSVLSGSWWLTIEYGQSSHVNAARSVYDSILRHILWLSWQWRRIGCQKCQNWPRPWKALDDWFWSQVCSGSFPVSHPELTNRGSIVGRSWLWRWCQEWYHQLPACGRFPVCQKQQTDWVSTQTVQNWEACRLQCPIPWAGVRSGFSQRLTTRNAEIYISPNWNSTRFWASVSKDSLAALQVSARSIYAV